MVNKRYCSTNFFTIAGVVWIWFFYDVSNVVNLYTISFDVNISNSLHWSINFLIIDSINNCIHYFKLLINTKLYYTFSLQLGLDSAFAFFSTFSFFFFLLFFSSRAGFVDFSTAFVHCSQIHKHHFSVTFSLKMGPMAACRKTQPKSNPKKTRRNE